MNRLLLLALILLLPACASTPPTDHPASAVTPSIVRVWRGRVPAARADEYEQYLRAGIAKFPTIPGNMGVDMMRRDLSDATVEFVVTSYWPSLDAIRAYAGDDIERVRDLPRDHEFLIDPERNVRHYQIREHLPGHQ
jgi:heme-degrading monooxygenase HmoA